MSWGIVASVGATLVGSYMTADAAGNAADTQAASAEAGIQEERRQFDKVQELLKPYVTAGQTALGGLAPFAAAGAPALEQQQALIGLKGTEAERAAIGRISGGETFKALAAQGENALLQNASATGGLRGGNIQGALAQFRPQLLSQLIDQQYGRLGGMTVLGAENTGNLARLGQASAAGTATAAQTTGTNIATLLGQQGQAQAGGQLAQGKAYAAIPGAIAGGIGEYIGRGGTF
jgi:hypothetical protein